MANPERSHEPLATAAQTRKIYGYVGAQALVNGTHGETGDFLDLPVDVLPSEVAVHMPSLEDGSQQVEHSVHLEEYKHSLLYKPKSPQDLTVVRFSRTEHISKDRGYITDVSYYVTRNEHGSWLERRVTGSVKQSRARKGLEDMGTGMQVRLRAIAPAVRAEREAREIVRDAEQRVGLEQERALGLLDVTANEAEQVVHFLESIPSEQP